MKLMNILARFSIDFSVTIVAATHVLSWKEKKDSHETVIFSAPIYRNIYILLTKREGGTRKISARGLDNTYIKDCEPIFSRTIPSKLG